MLDLQPLRFDFPPFKGRALVFTKRVGFASKVTRSSAVIRGFDIGFNNGEHPLLRTQIDVSTSFISDTAIDVIVNFSIRDNSGNFDDPYSGFVDVLVIADRA
jgi:hypothetical protein